MADIGSLVRRNKLRKVILGDKLSRALLHERGEPAERPHAEYIRGQQRALGIQARFVVRFGTELWAEALKSKRNDAEPTNAPSQHKNEWSPRVRDGGTSPD